MAAATATYSYSVRDKAGKLVSGMKKEIHLGFKRKRVKLKDLAVFSRQFATMLNSGLSLLRALNILTEQTENPEFARIIGDVRSDIEVGNALSVAMGKHPKVFPPLMVNMCKAGEVGGFLDSVMLQVAQNYEAEVKLRGKVKAAMTYPVAVFCIAIIAVIAMLLFVVPTFAKLFKDLGGTLPAPTRLLVFMSKELKLFFPFLIIMFIASVIVWQKVKHQERVRRVVDPLKLKVPVFGKLFQKISLSRFTRNLGTMMHSGVPILQALDIVADTTGNMVVGDAVRDVQESVRQGESLALPLKNHPVFPPMVVQMMAVGEDTGALDTMLHKISEFYDQEVEATTEALTALIEPLMIAVLGGIVGSMIISLYMPIFKIFNLIQG